MRLRGPPETLRNLHKILNSSSEREFLPTRVARVLCYRRRLLSAQARHWKHAGEGRESTNPAVRRGAPERRLSANTTVVRPASAGRLKPTQRLPRAATAPDT